MNNQGWIKLHRKLLESTVFTSEKGLKIWIWCLLKANHNGADVFNGRQKIHIQAGQFVTGRNTAQEELEMAVGTIWFWLDQLQRDKYIERKSTNKYSVITILNYNSYQQTERRLNADRTQIVQQIEPNKNDKNEKNDNKTSKTSLTPCNEQDLKDISLLLGVSLDDTKRTHQIILNKIEAHEFKGKTIYYSLKNWILMGIERGTIKKNVVLSNYKLMNPK